MSFKKFVGFTSFLFLSASLAHADLSAAQPSVEPSIVQSLAQTLLQCTFQPYGTNLKTGNRVFGALRSRCNQVLISQDRAELSVAGRDYTILVKDSEQSDGGDLNDLFVQFDSREDQEYQVASNLLSFGDPALSILLLTGHAASELPQVPEPSLNQ